MKSSRNSALSTDAKLTAKEVFANMVPTHFMQGSPILLLPEATASKDTEKTKHGSLRKYWAEGTRFMGPKSKKPSESPQSSHSAVTPDSGDPPESLTKKMGKKASRPSLGTYWSEGTSHTLNSFMPKGKRRPSDPKDKKR